METYTLFSANWSDSECRREDKTTTINNARTGMPVKLGDRLIMSGFRIERKGRGRGGDLPYDNGHLRGSVTTLFT